ncbi:MAG: hypothetical protein V4577_31165 [Bacteroidota bacterium]
MSKNNRVIFYLIFICTVIINATTLINGAREHETWRIIIGAASIGLMAGAGIVMLMNKRRQKNRQAS